MLTIALLAPPAGASTRQTTSCGSLQQTIDTLAAQADHGAATVIVLDGLCTAGSLGSSHGVNLPAGSSFTLEGKPRTTSGFNGVGISGPLLSTSGSEEAGAIVLVNLTFEDASLSEASALSLRAERVTLSNDTFESNAEQGSMGSAARIEVGANASTCPSPSGPPVFTLAHSLFVKNTLTVAGGAGSGGAALVHDECGQSRALVEGNTFEDNVIHTSGAWGEDQVTGAGLQVTSSEAQIPLVTQRANVFDSNSIIASQPALGDYGGGGEWLQYARLQSVDDRFSRNVAAGTDSPMNWSWAAGLGIDALPCRIPLLESVLDNAVVSGNVLTAGFRESIGGGGIWVGCSHLRVFDSTFTENSAPIGSAIEGEEGDQLQLTNSIVSGDEGSSEVAGFYGPGSSQTVSYSDICTSPGATTPSPGTGNICASPRLADAGRPSSFDVQETASSPTVNAGSNALIPAGLSADFYGNHRILAAQCARTGKLARMRQAVVDIGASELRCKTHAKSPATPRRNPKSR
jgi:hypothetical protein